MAPERPERIRKRTEELLAELPLQELRQCRALSQQELAEVLGHHLHTRATDGYVLEFVRFAGLSKR